MTKDEMFKLFTAAGFEEHAELMESCAERCVSFHTTPLDEDDLAIGSSRLGGHPDLPIDLEWPAWNGRPLDFLVQLDLSEISGFKVCKHLPPSGRLYFFYDSESMKWGFDPADRGSWRVMFSDKPKESLQRIRIDGAVPSPLLYNSCALSFRESLSGDWAFIPIDMLNLKGRDLKQYEDFIFELPASSSLHQVLGEPNPIQSFSCSDMQERCQWASNGLYLGGSGGPSPDRAELERLRPGATEWRLLLQLDSDENAEMEWVDSGRLYFFIREEELEKRDFDNVWMILECY